MALPASETGSGAWTARAEGEECVDDPNDRFGTPESAFAAALENHGRDNATFRMGMYVPTRHEVATLPAAELGDILDLWMWESPSELIPSRDQIAQVREVLRARPDAANPEILDIIGWCDEYVAPGGQ